MKEALYVPEEHLEEVIRIIRNGLRGTKEVSEEVREELNNWCRETKEYLKSLGE